MKVHPLLGVCLALLICSALVPGALRAAEQGGPPPADKPPPPAKPLPVSLSLLGEAAQAALANCKAAGWPVGVAVVDADGSMRLSMRDAGSGGNSIEVAYRKAYTAAKTGMSSDEYSKTLAADDIVYASATPGSTRRGEPGVRNGDPLFLPKAGAVLIRVDGKIVGAIGVSGRPAGADVDCANAGLEKIAAARS
jgi:uncharacterized protein GlcG (DUF336 family)